MKFKTGDVFTTTQDYIGHGVNTQGAMGAGVAKAVRDKYPHAYDVYRSACFNGKLKPGGALGVFDGGKVIVNLASQEKTGADARYEWVFSSCLDAARILTHDGKKRVMAVPQIGAGIGGLEWPKVQRVLETVEFIYPNLEFEVWEYKP